MATTKDLMRIQLKYRLANRSDLTTTQLNQWLDRGLLDLGARIRIRQLDARDQTKTFTAGSNEVDFPEDFIAILDIRNSTADQPLNYIDWPKFRNIKIVSGTPRLWTVFGTTIYLDKLATSPDDLDMFGIKQAIWPAADAAAGIDDQLEYGILLLAAAQAFRDLGDEEKAALIDNPLQPGTGQFWAWVRANRLPTLMQGMANRTGYTAGVQVQLAGYNGVG